MKFIREHNKVYAKDEKGELLAEVVFPNVTKVADRKSVV